MNGNNRKSATMPDVWLKQEFGLTGEHDEE